MSKDELGGTLHLILAPLLYGLIMGLILGLNNPKSLNIFLWQVLFSGSEIFNQIYFTFDCSYYFENWFYGFNPRKQTITFHIYL